MILLGTGETGSAVNSPSGSGQTATAKRFCAIFSANLCVQEAFFPGVVNRCVYSQGILLLIPLSGVLLAVTIVVIAALRSRCGHYIFALWFLSSFFPRLISADWMSTILPHMMIVALVRI